MSEFNILIAGYSGHGFVVAETCIEQGLNLKGYIDKSASKDNPFNILYCGFEEDTDFIISPEKTQFVLGIGDNLIRKKTGQILQEKGGELLNVIHSSSSISASSTLGVGNFVARNAVVNTLAEIGDFCIVNTGAIIEHECKLGNAVHVAPGAVLAGNVSIGEGSFVGANAVVKQGVKIGKNVIIGAGAVVLNDINDNKTAVGNPAKEI